MLSYSLLFSKKNLATNSPDSQRKVGSDEFCSIPSDSNSKSPTAKLLVEKELESLREQAVARNVREKYSGSHSFMSPEETIAYLGKQRKRTFNSPAPPSNLIYIYIYLFIYLYTISQLNNSLYDSLSYSIV